MAAMVPHSPLNVLVKPEKERKRERKKWIKPEKKRNETKNEKKISEETREADPE